MEGNRSSTRNEVAEEQAEELASTGGSDLAGGAIAGRNAYGCRDHDDNSSLDGNGDAGKSDNDSHAIEETISSSTSDRLAPQERIQSQGYAIVVKCS